MSYRAFDVYRTDQGRAEVPSGLKRLLQSISLTVEVFLHQRLGKHYVSLGRVLQGMGFLFFCVLLQTLGFSLGAIPGFEILWMRPHFDWPESPQVFEERFTGLFLGSFKEIQEVPTALWLFGLWRPGVALAVKAMGLFWVMCLFHRGREFLLRNREELNAWSDGESYPIWEWIYRLQIRAQIRGDLVKQYFEPGVCLLLSQLLLRIDQPGPQFLGIWLFIIAPILLGKAWDDNRFREREELERGAAKQKQAAIEAGAEHKPDARLQPARAAQLSGSDQPEA